MAKNGEKKRAREAERIEQEVKAAYRALGQAVCLGKTGAQIPLKVTDENPAEISVAKKVVERLKEDGFGVYCKKQDTTREYYITCSERNTIVVPYGFEFIE